MPMHPVPTSSTPIAPIISIPPSLSNTKSNSTLEQSLSASTSSSSSSSSTQLSLIGSWFGDFSALCISDCIPLPACNLLLSIPEMDQLSLSSFNATRISGTTEMTESWSNRCLNHGWPVRDVGSVIISVFGLALVIRRILCKSRRMFSAVGRSEIGVLYMIYSFILLLQIFTVGGVLQGASSNKNNQTFLTWATALHLGALVCFFWTLTVTALTLFQFAEDGTKYMMRWITGTNLIWMGIVVFMSLDLAWNITGQHGGQSPGLFFVTLIFPVVSAIFYLILCCIVVFQKLEVYCSLKYIAMAMMTFAGSQWILFGASYRIAMATHGRINGSIFSLLLDLFSVTLTYKFWHSITDDTWGDEEL